MIQVMHITGFNPDTGQEETLYVVDSADFLANGQSYIPIVTNRLDFSVSLFSQGTVQGELEIGVGDIVLSNIDGKLDKYRRYGFDGRLFQVFAPNDKTERFTDVSNLLFTGTMTNAQFSWSNMTISVKGALQKLAVPMCTGSFLGTNIGTGGAGGYEGGTDLAATQKPQTFGRCMSVEGVCVNEFYLVFAFNYDNTGNYKQMAQFYNVYVKGVRYIYSGTDYATPELMIAAVLTGLGAGYYVTCLAAGMIRLSSTPASNGKVVADCADALDGSCSAAQVVERILMDNASLTSADFNVLELRSLDNWNLCPVGIHITDNTNIIDAVNQLLDSIGAWIAEDQFGVFRFGYIDLTDNLIAAGNTPLVTITRRHFADTIERVVTDDEDALPAYSVEIQHTKNWAVQDSGSLADSVSQYYRQFFTKEYRSAKTQNEYSRTLHKLAPSLVYQTLLNDQLYLALLNGDFTIPVATAGNGWTLTGAGTPTASGGNGFILVVSGAGSGSTLTQVISTADVFAGAGTYELIFTAGSIGNPFTAVVKNALGVSVAAVAVPSGAAGLVYTLTFTIPVGYTALAWGSVSVIFSNAAAGKWGFGNVLLRAVRQGKAPASRAIEVMSVQGGFQERFTLAIPLKFYADNTLRVGTVITLQDDFDRFDLVDGKNFLIIGTAPDIDNYQVQLDVLRVEPYFTPSIT